MATKTLHSLRNKERDAKNKIIDPYKINNWTVLNFNKFPYKSANIRKKTRSLFIKS